MEVPEIDPNFEPQIRARSNTWPVRPREIDVDSEEARTPNSVHSEVDTERHEEPIPELGEGGKADTILSQKKGGSRRNAWGNLSYADLITKAVQSSPEQRLTLSQIYDWMVQNVPYFRDKGDSNSSAGWKNSIRHNLSLHSRFMRIQNEGTGKSSWWVLNPDAKPGKTPRRRATSMDTKAYEKKRGRVKRKVEQLRAAMEGQGLGEGSSYGGSARELNFPDPYNLSPQDPFRERVSSNASSIGGGRLSPIQYQNEYEDMCDVPSMSPLPWGQGSAYPGSEGFAESITESLAGMLVGNDPNMMSPDVQDSLVTSSSPIRQQMSPNYQDQNPSYLQVGGYQDHMRQASPQLSPQAMGNITNMNNARINTTLSNGYSQGQGINTSSNGMGMRPQGRSNYIPPQTLTELLEQPDAGEDDMEQQTLGNNVAQNNTSMITQFLNNPVAFQQRHQQQQQQINSQGINLANLTPQQRNLLTTSLLRQVLCNTDASQQLANKNSVSPSGGNMQQQHLASQKTGYISPQNGMSGNSSPMSSPMLSRGAYQSQNMTSLSGGSMMTPQEQLQYDMNLTDIKPSDFTGCPDVDQMIKHELSFDDNLDFAFAEQLQQAAANAVSQGSNCETQGQSATYNGTLQT